MFNQTSIYFECFECCTFRFEDQNNSQNRLKVAVFINMRSLRRPLPTGGKPSTWFPPGWHVELSPHIINFETNYMISNTTMTMTMTMPTLTACRRPRSARDGGLGPHVEHPWSFEAGPAHSHQPSILRVWSAMRLIVLISSHYKSMLYKSVHISFLQTSPFDFIFSMM